MADEPNDDRPDEDVVDTSTATLDPDPAPVEDRDSDDDPKPRDDDTVSPEEYRRLRDDYNRLKRQAGEREKERRKAEREKAAAEGRWKDVAEDAQKERDEALQKAQEWQAKYTTLDQTIRVNRIAERLHFRNPSLAYRLLDPEDREDDGLAEAALKKIARENEGLIDKQRRSAAPVTGRDGKPLTPEDGLNRTVADFLLGR